MSDLSPKSSPKLAGPKLEDSLSAASTDLIPKLAAVQVEDSPSASTSNPTEPQWECLCGALFETNEKLKEHKTVHGLFQALPNPPMPEPPSTTERIGHLKAILLDDTKVLSHANIRAVIADLENGRLDSGETVYYQFGKRYKDEPSPAPGSTIWIEAPPRVYFQFKQLNARIPGTR